MSAISQIMTDSQNQQTEVLYNADCPVCSFEINHYAKISRSEALGIKFSDLNDAEKLAQWGLTREVAAKRLHVRKGDALLSGIPAFVELWQGMPRYRWLARFVSLPVIRGCAVFVYDKLLAPALFWWDAQRQRNR